MVNQVRNLKILRKKVLLNLVLILDTDRLLVGCTASSARAAARTSIYGRIKLPIEKVYLTPSARERSIHG
eukprot:SAG31_NODE_19624_length_596_cov_1.348089_1_plen_70_part_00